jgi:hypothetical protein
LRCRELKVDETLLADSMAKDRLMAIRDAELVDEDFRACPDGSQKVAFDKDDGRRWQEHQPAVG